MRIDLEEQLPVAHVDPLAEFAADLSKMRHLLKPELFVHGNACVVRKRDTAHHNVHLALTQRSKQSFVEPRPDTSSG